MVTEGRLFYRRGSLLVQIHEEIIESKGLNKRFVEKTEATEKETKTLQES